MGNTNRWRNKVIRGWDPQRGRARRLGVGKEGVAALREHRATKKASGKSRRSGWSKRPPSWLRNYLYPEGS